MTRSWLVIVCCAALLRPSSVVAQFQHHHNSRTINTQAYNLPLSGYPTYAYNSYSAPGFGGHHSHHYGRPYFLAAYWSQPVPVSSYPVSFIPMGTPFVIDSAKPTTHSTPAAKLKSLDLQARGDQRMREQKWSEARAAYANSVAAAPDRAEAHMRLGICFVAIQRFDSAIREFKRALVLDPMSARTGKTLKELFGSDSQIVRTSIISKLGEWVRDDRQNPDRLFLFGAMLHFDGDSQGREVLETALKMKNGGDSNHIAVFLNPQFDPLNGHFGGNAEGLPALNDRPQPAFVARPFADLRFPKANSPLPMPDGPVPMPDGPVPMP